MLKLKCHNSVQILFQYFGILLTAKKPESSPNLSMSTTSVSSVEKQPVYAGPKFGM